MVDAERLSADGSEVGRVIPNAPLRSCASTSRLPERERLYHTPPPWVGSREVYFITICCTPRKVNQLARSETFPVIVNALEHYLGSGKLWPHLLLAMPDHLHALLSFPSQERMDGLIRNWKRYVAKLAQIRWQDGFFDHRLRDNENFEQKAHYIRMNPVRAGLAQTPETWAYVCPQTNPGAAR